MWLEIVKITKDLLGDLIKTSKEKKEKVSILLDEISDLLMSVSEDLEKDQYPHSSCSMMRVLTIEFYDKIKFTLDEEKSIYLENLLIQASLLEREFALRKEPETIIKLKEASGEFKAFSKLLKI